MRILVLLSLVVAIAVGLNLKTKMQANAEQICGAGDCSSGCFQKSQANGGQCPDESNADTYNAAETAQLWDSIDTGFE